MPTRKPPSWGAAVRAHPWLTATGLTLVVVLSAVTLLGGWARSAPEGPVRAAPGAEVDATPFRVRLDEASARFELGGTDAEPGQAFVVVEGRLELTVRASVAGTALTDAFTADLTRTFDQSGSPSEEPQPSVRVAADGSSLLGLGPGLRYDVQVVFVVAEDAVPERLTMTLLEQTRRPSALDGELRWFDAAPVARITLPVAALPASRPEPEGF